MLIIKLSILLLVIIGLVNGKKQIGETCSVDDSLEACEDGLECTLKDSGYVCVDKNMSEADGRCGGLLYSGPRKCPAGYECKKKALVSRYSHCVALSTTTAEAPTTSTSLNIQMVPYGKCGGWGWKGPKICLDGHVCKKMKRTDWHHVCVPHPQSSTSTEATEPYEIVETSTEQVEIAETSTEKAEITETSTEQVEIKETSTEQVEIATTQEVEQKQNEPLEQSTENPATTVKVTTEKTLALENITVTEVSENPSESTSTFKPKTTTRRRITATKVATKTATKTPARIVSSTITSNMI